jgi:hypothetical protein
MLVSFGSPPVFSFNPRSYTTQHPVQQILGVRRSEAGLNSRKGPLLIAKQRAYGKQVHKVFAAKAGFST